MAFDKTLPIEGALAPTYNDIMRADKTALETALNAYMYFATGGTQTGQPRQGQARPYFQDSAPTTRLDGDYFDSTDLGCLWIDSDSSPVNQVNFLSAANGAGTETWTPISTEVIAVLLASARVFAGTLGVTGNFAVNTNKFTVAASTGNTAVAGTLGVTGIATVAKGSKLASSDAPTTDAMLATKKYVDDSVGAANYTPTSYAGEESITFPNGLIVKSGEDSDTSATPGAVSFGDDFPNGVVSLQLTMKRSSSGGGTAVKALSISGFTALFGSTTDGYYWTARGY